MLDPCLIQFRQRTYFVSRVLSDSITDCFPSRFCQKCPVKLHVQLSSARITGHEFQVVECSLKSAAIYWHQLCRACVSISLVYYLYEAASGQIYVEQCEIGVIRILFASSIKRMHVQHQHPVMLGLNSYIFICFVMYEVSACL